MNIQIERTIRITTFTLILSLVLLLPGVLATPKTLPTGVYSTTVTVTDIPATFPPEFVELLVGEWQTEYTSAGSYIVTKDGSIVVVGRYTSNATHLIMSDLQGAYACTDEPGIATGVYNWSLNGNELTLSPIRDRCVGRSAVLSAHPMQGQ